MDLLECREISKAFRQGAHRVQALSQVSLRLAPGEALGIVGESGSGKSTLLRIIAGLEGCDSGEIRMQGKSMSRNRSRADRHTMQMVFQNAGASFNPRRRICSSIREVMNNLLGDAPASVIDSLAQAVGMDPEYLDRYPSQLSGGQCQRFAIARAIAVRPQILLCDEITSALDVTTQEQIIQLLNKLRQESTMSMIFVSHDLAVVGKVCDRILVMREGKILEEGPTKELLLHPQEDYTKQLLESVLEVDIPC